MSNSLSTEPGFTLVEVMIALAVAAGGLLLLLSANRACLRRSLRSRDRVRLEQACQSKLNEILIGVETAHHGQLDRDAHYQWSVSEEPANAGDLEQLRRVIITIAASDGVGLTRSVLHYGPLPKITQ